MNSIESLSISCNPCIKNDGVLVFGMLFYNFEIPKKKKVVFFELNIAKVRINRHQITLTYVIIYDERDSHLEASAVQSANPKHERVIRCWFQWNDQIS